MVNIFLILLRLLNFIVRVCFVIFLGIFGELGIFNVSVFDLVLINREFVWLW